MEELETGVEECLHRGRGGASRGLCQSLWESQAVNMCWNPCASLGDFPAAGPEEAGSWRLAVSLGRQMGRGGSRVQGTGQMLLNWLVVASQLGELRVPETEWVSSRVRRRLLAMRTEDRRTAHPVDTGVAQAGSHSGRRGSLRARHPEEVQPEVGSPREESSKVREVVVGLGGRPSERWSPGWLTVDPGPRPPATRSGCEVLPGCSHAAGALLPLPAFVLQMQR